MITQATLLGQLHGPVPIGAQFYSARPGQSHIFAFEVLGDLAEASATARRMEAAGNVPAPVRHAVQPEASAPAGAEIQSPELTQTEPSAVATKRRPPKTKPTADAGDDPQEP